MIFQRSVGVVASTDAPLCEAVISIIVGFVAAADMVNIRGKYSTKDRIGWVPLTAIEAAVQTIRPDTQIVTLPPAGKRSGFIRDRNLVRASSTGMLVFFSEGKLMAGGSGHVVETCIVESVPVEAYVVHDDGHVDLFAAS